MSSCLLQIFIMRSKDLSNLRRSLVIFKFLFLPPPPLGSLIPHNKTLSHWHLFLLVKSNYILLITRTKNLGVVTLPLRFPKYFVINPIRFTLKMCPEADHFSLCPPLLLRSGFLGYCPGHLTGLPIGSLVSTSMVSSQFLRVML